MAAKVCSVEDCDRPSTRWGLCPAHAARQQKHGDPLAHIPLGSRKSLTKPATPEVCKVEGCDRPQQSGGKCSGHYQRWRKYGDVRADRPLKNNGRRLHDLTCSIAGCEQPTVALGLCGGHRRRKRLYGDALGGPAPRGQTPARVCEIDGCSEPARAKGLCAGHRAKLRRYGDPLIARQAGKIPRSGTCNVDGCGRPVVTHGMCTRHAGAYYRLGDVNAGTRRRRFNDEIEATCTVRGCDKPHRSRGYCHFHYQWIVREGHKRRGKHHGGWIIAERTLRRIYESPCQVCGSRDRITIDHVVPLSRGGEHREGNLRPLCRKCNTRKSDRFDSEWRHAKALAARRRSRRL
jgi:hypothetical protein